MPKPAPIITYNNRVKLVRGGNSYFKLVTDLIGQARESIHLQTYIFCEDETGTAVAQALMSAAKRKVQVYLLVDGYASQQLSDTFIASLKNAGVHFRFFEPLFKNSNFYFGRRMHHKILVTDARFALTGGINVSNNYNDSDEGAAWLDFALYSEGEIAGKLCVLCWKAWNNFAGMGVTPCEQNKPVFDFAKTERCEVAMRRNDWVRRKNEISATYIHMLTHASSHITIMCSYFLPGKVIRRLLKRAINRGIKIKVIVAGVSDVAVAKYAERWMYDWMLRNGLEVYEYQPAVLHAKIAVCDAAWLTIGSYNVNNISAYASIELNLDVHNAALARQTEDMLYEIISKNCKAITQQNHVYRNNIVARFARWCSYQFIRFTFYLFTFYFKHKD